MCTYKTGGREGVGNFSFSENFAYVNECSLKKATVEKVVWHIVDIFLLLNFSKEWVNY